MAGKCDAIRFMNTMLEKFFGFLLVVLVFTVGGGAIWYLSRSDSKIEVEEDWEDDSQQTTISEVPSKDVSQNIIQPQVPSTPMPKTQVVEPPEKESEEPKQVNVRPQRYPPNLPESSVYFEVIEGGYAITQGDILMGKIPEDKPDLKNGISEPKRTLLWPTNTIPYTISGEISNHGPIIEAINYFNQNTAVQFVPAEQGDEDFLVFIPIEEHCASHVGRVGGAQAVLVSAKCGKTEVIHELMHALGFVHEHSRSDRDKYVEILWKNIQEPYLFQFNKMPDQMIHSYSGSVFNFDPESVMLYADTAFAKTLGQKTMRSKGRVALNPSRGELSRMDKERIYYLYGQ